MFVTMKYWFSWREARKNPLPKNIKSGYRCICQQGRPGGSTERHGQAGLVGQEQLYEVQQGQLPGPAMQLYRLGK